MRKSDNTGGAATLEHVLRDDHGNRVDQIAEFTPEELQAIVRLENCVRRTIDPLKVVLLIEKFLLDLGFRSDIHVITDKDENSSAETSPGPGRGTLRCLFAPDPELTGDDFSGWIDLFPIDPERAVDERDRRFLDFFCEQAGFVLAHQWVYQKLSRTQENLRSALNTVQEISAFVGHEIRSPLASLHSLHYLTEELVQEFRRQKEISRDDWNQLADKMTQSSALLQKVVRSTYLLGTLEMDSETFQREQQWVEMGASLLLSAGSAYSFEIRRRNLLVVIRRDSRFANELVLVHRTWFEAIFDNLLGNAIKYSSEGGRIDFSILEYEGQYVIHVSNPVDEAPSAERLNRLFEKGYRGDAGFSQKDIGANQGLGLYFVNRIVTLGYGGTIKVWVAPGRNRDGADLGEAVETRTFGNPDITERADAETFFHIEIRLDQSALDLVR